MRGPCCAAWLAAAAVVAPGAGLRLAAQEPPSAGSLGAIDQALRFLGHNKRVLMIAAHPDDEDTELLTVLVRGMGSEAAYLSLSRGEGGQNLIGPELGEGLGILRTEELLAARRLDGARQYFGRAFDFGYSKGLPDTWAHWPQDSVLKDVVRVIRRFRPHLIVSQFSGTPRDGHGQHQAAGWAAREGFHAAADPNRFPELAREEGLEAWAPAKLYQSARFSGDASLTLEGGVLDPAVGQSFHQIAMRGRSLHRSQDMGVLQRTGPSPIRLHLVEDRTGRGSGSLWAGVDTTLASLAPSGSGPRVRQALNALAARLTALTPWTVRGRRDLRRELGRLLGEGTPGMNPAAADQVRRMDDALFLASGVLCDALSARERLVPGGTVGMVLSCWNASSDTVRVEGTLRMLGRAVGRLGPRSLPPGAVATESLTVAVPADARPTNPYFLDLPRAPGIALYQWPAGIGPLAGMPFEPPPARAEFHLAGRGAGDREVTYRWVDQATGERRHPVVIVPRVAVAVTPAAVLRPTGGSPVRPPPVQVRLRAEGNDPVSGTVWLEGPPGWDPGPPQPFTLEPPGRTELTVAFQVTPPPGLAPGRYTLRAVARDAAGREYRQGVVAVSYPHIRPRQFLQAAELEVVVAPLAPPSVGRIAYVRGAADRVPEALLALGLPVVELGADSLARGDLSPFDVVVIGPRAYEAEPALRNHSARLLDYARAGGTVVVQYQQQVFFREGFAPWPLDYLPGGDAGDGFRVSAPRVAEEGAPVRVLVPDHPAFSFPNRIGPEDWEGWVQERGLYFVREWDDRWQPLLEMADTGEPPQQGGLLVAPVGRGVYVYTGLSFFRQLPAAVPGAARLFLNLLALRGNGAR